MYEACPLKIVYGSLGVNTSEMIHGWISRLVIIIKVIDHVLGFYFICAHKESRTELCNMGFILINFYKQESPGYQIPLAMP